MMSRIYLFLVITFLTLFYEAVSQNCPPEGYWTNVGQPYCNDTCGNCGVWVQGRVCDTLTGCPCSGPNHTQVGGFCAPQVCKFPRKVCCIGVRKAVNNVYDGYFQTTNGSWLCIANQTNTTTSAPTTTTTNPCAYGTTTLSPSVRFNVDSSAQCYGSCQWGGIYYSSSCPDPSVTTTTVGAIAVKRKRNIVDDVFIHRAKRQSTTGGYCVNGQYYGNNVYWGSGNGSLVNSMAAFTLSCYNQTQVVSVNRRKRERERENEDEINRRIREKRVTNISNCYCNNFAVLDEDGNCYELGGQGSWSSGVDADGDGTKDTYYGFYASFYPYCDGYQGTPQTGVGARKRRQTTPECHMYLNYIGTLYDQSGNPIHKSLYDILNQQGVSDINQLNVNSNSPFLKISKVSCNGCAAMNCVVPTPPPSNNAF